MEGEGMVAVVRGLQDTGLAVTLVDGNRQYTLLPNSMTQPAPYTPRAQVTIVNTSTQQHPIKCTAESSTESAQPQCDRDVQAVDGRYASVYKTVHCNLRPTSPPVQVTEFPPQRPDHHPGHGNFQVGGAGSGVTDAQIRDSSPVTSYRGGMSWPDRGSVCSPRPSYEVDAFANSLRKYPCLSPDRSSEVMERLINYTQHKTTTKSRNSYSPTRVPEPPSYHSIEPRNNFTKFSRSYDPDITFRSKKMEDTPTRDRRKEDHVDTRHLRSLDVRCVRDMSKRMRENPYNHPVCPTIKENHDCQSSPYECQNSSNSVNMEIQAAVEMLSKEVATNYQEHLTEKTVAVPGSPTSSAGEDNVEGECYFVPNLPNLDIKTSVKYIQTNFCPSDISLKPRKSAQTVCSTTDFRFKRKRFTVDRNTKSQELINVTKDKLKRRLLELIEEVSNTTLSNNICDELVKKLFETDSSERDDNKGNSATFCPSCCDYVDDFKQLVGRLKRYYGQTKYVLRSEFKPVRISEYRQLDFILKDWIHNLNLENEDIGRYIDRGEILNSVEDTIKELFKNKTIKDFDLKSGIVKIIEELPIKVNKGYNRKSYLHKLVDVLLNRMRNVNQQSERIRRRFSVNRSRRILTEDNIRDFLRAHLLNFFNEYKLDICDDTLDDLENDLMDVIIDSIDCIRCGHVDDAINEMDIILQDLSQMSDIQAKYISGIILQDLQEMLYNCNFNQTYMILNVNSNLGHSSNKTNNTDVSIGCITEEDLCANIDHYTTQLCQQINQWLDSLNIPEIQDTSFREVVVNDLAADIVDRNKYMELNNIDKGTEEDELEALKYQIFKWINKLVGDDNKETIGNAKRLLEKVNTVPVPMLINPKHREIFSKRSEETPQEFLDPMKHSLGEIRPHTCEEENLILKHNKPCCLKDSTLPCCKKDTCPMQNVQGTSKIHIEVHIPSQGLNAKSLENFANVRLSQSSGSPGPISCAAQNGYTPLVCGQGGQNDQGGRVPYMDGQGFGPFQSPYSQVVQVGPGGGNFVQSGIPNHQWEPKSTGFGPGQAGNVSQTPYDSVRPSFERMETSGGSFSPMDPYHTYNPNLQSMNSVRPSGVTGEHSKCVPNPGTTGPITSGQMGCNFNSEVGTNQSVSSGRPDGLRLCVDTHNCCRSGSSPQTPTSARNINEDYDNYLKQWVEEIPIAAKTPAEQQLADNVKLGIYNGVWKSVTKIKLDPNIFGNPYCYEDAFEEELEELFKGVPKSDELEAAKPTLKAQLLQKTLDTNHQIKTTSAPTSYEQRLIENIENNLPKTTPTTNEEEQQTEELEKQDLADYFILYTRFKNEDIVKANAYQNNFLKKLNEFLDKIKTSHNIKDINTISYANEIINSLDKVPTPNELALKDESDDILLGMEVENWIAELPKQSDTARPLENRRIRDTIVKKKHQIGINMNCYDTSFATSLKAEILKHLEKIPIKEGTNVDYKIDELVNRIKNLSKFVRRKSVSFQVTENYEEFSKNIPAASSYIESSQLNGSYYIAGGKVVEKVDHKSRVSDKTSVPDDGQWLSMQTTQAPSGLRNWSEGQRSHKNMDSQHHTQNIPDQTSAPGCCSYGSNRVQGQFSPDTQGQFTCNPQGQLVSSDQAQFSPNFKSGPLPGGQVCTETPCCQNKACSNRAQGPRPFSQPPAQVSNGSHGQSLSNAQISRMPYSQDQSFGHSYEQGVETSQSPHGQRSPGQCNHSFSLARHPQGQLLGHPGQVSDGPNGQGFSNDPGSQMHPQGSFTGYFGEVPHGGNGQAFINGQNGIVPGSQSMHPHGPYAGHSGQIPYGRPHDQGLLMGGSVPDSQMHTSEKHAGQVFQGDFSQMRQNGQDGLVPGSQMCSQGQHIGHPSQGHQHYCHSFSNSKGRPCSSKHSFVPCQSPHGQKFPNGLYNNGQRYSPQSPYGNDSNNTHDRGAYQEPYEAQMGQVNHGNYSQDFANDQGSPVRAGQAYGGREYSNGCPYMNAEVQPSTPCQVPDPNETRQSQIAGVYQDAGFSRRTERTQTGQTQNGQAHPTFGSQRLSATDSTYYPEFYKSTDREGIQQIIEHNKTSKLPTYDQNPQADSMFVQIGCSTPVQPNNQGVQDQQRPMKKTREQGFGIDEDMNAQRRLDKDEADSGTEKVWCRCVKRGRRCKARKHTKGC